jgi:hypothetical protein
MTPPIQGASRTAYDVRASFENATLDERQVSYTPPPCDDGRKWMPDCPDRLDAASQPKLQERITAARIGRDIAEFFRATDQLGAGNDEKLAMEDFERQFVRDEETFRVQ